MVERFRFHLAKLGLRAEQGVHFRLRRSWSHRPQLKQVNLRGLRTTLLKIYAAHDWAHTVLRNLFEVHGLAESGPLVLDVLDKLSALLQALRQAAFLLPLR